MEKHLTLETVDCFVEAFEDDPKNRLALNAVTQTDITTVALNRDVVNRVDHTYSHLIETPKVTNQKSSGRCWMFAGLNALRLETLKNLNLDQFEFSQTHLMFWDKLEKSNFFLENILETCNEPLDGRLIQWLLSQPLSDGGQWDMFINLIEKYGVVPKSVMPETQSSSNSRRMNSMVVLKLRECASILRKMHGQGGPIEALREAKGKMLQDIHRILSIHLGKPPTQFSWSWRDKDKQFHRKENMTPQECYKTFVGVDLNDYVCLINAPTEDKPYNKLYTVQYLGNVVGGQIVRYVNVDMATLKQATVEMVKNGEAVWFGCDVGKMFQRDLGILDLDIHDYELVYGTDFSLDKAGRLDYGHSRMTHAMVLTGVDLDHDEQPRKWRVENSWGTEHGDKGYEMMTDAWFEEYLYEITVHKKYLSDELLNLLDTDPIVLPPWDPMGSLATSR
ncbi:MAG: C1 family peptidase [bacterium]|nr:C1 family peptidase [bacterium]